MLYESSTGSEVTHEVERSTESSSSVTTGRESTNSHAVEYSTTMGTEVSASASAGFPGGFSGSVTASVSYESSLSTSTEVSMTWSEEQTRENSEGFSEAEALAQSEGTTITGGVLAVTVDVENEGDIAYTLSNLAISAYRSTPGAEQILSPVGTLNFDTEFNSFPEFSYGPRQVNSPLVFLNDGLDVGTAESLLTDSTDLHLRVVAYELTDVDGRSFTHDQTDIMARTATIIVDYEGEDTLLDSERYQVATNVDAENLRVAAARRWPEVHLGAIVEEGAHAWPGLRAAWEALPEAAQATLAVLCRLPGPAHRVGLEACGDAAGVGPLVAAGWARVFQPGSLSVPRAIADAVAPWRDADTEPYLTWFSQKARRRAEEWEHTGGGRDWFRTGLWSALWERMADDRPPGWLLRGWALSGEDLDALFAALESAGDRVPHVVRARCAARALQTRSARQDAVRVLEGALAVPGGDADQRAFARLELAVAYHRVRRITDAEAAYRTAATELSRVGITRAHTLAVANLAGIAHDLARWDEARQGYLDAITAFAGMGSVACKASSAATWGRCTSSRRPWTTPAPPSARPIGASTTRRTATSAASPKPTWATWSCSTATSTSPTICTPKPSSSTARMTPPAAACATRGGPASRSCPPPPRTDWAWRWPSSASSDSASRSSAPARAGAWTRIGAWCCCARRKASRPGPLSIRSPRWQPPPHPPTACSSGCWSTSPWPCS